MERNQIIFAAKQLSETTTVANLLAMNKIDFESAIKSIRKEYKLLYGEQAKAGGKQVEGQKAFYLVLKTAKKIQKDLGIDISAEQAVESAINKLSRKTDKKVPKLMDYNKYMWLQCFADRIATVLQSAKFDAECDAAEIKDKLCVAQNAVWRGYMDGDTSTAYSDHIIRHGIHGEDWESLQMKLFDNLLICDYLKESERYDHLSFDISKYVMPDKDDDGGKQLKKTQKKQKEDDPQAAELAQNQADEQAE